MKQLPKNITKVSSYRENENNTYIIHGENATKVIETNTKEKFGYKIIERNDYINGFQLVKFSDGLFGYVRNDKILRYKFELATDFNEYGLAIVGNYGSIGWVNKNFDFYSTSIINGKTKDLSFIHINNEEINKHLFLNHGWNSITTFNKDSSLSLLKGDKDCFIDEFGNIKTFKHIDHNYQDLSSFNEIYSDFTDDTFTEAKHILFNKEVLTLLEDGYYLTNSDFKVLAIQYGIIDKVIEKAKTLKK